MTYSLRSVMELTALTAVLVSLSLIPKWGLLLCLGFLHFGAFATPAMLVGWAIVANINSGELAVRDHSLQDVCLRFSTVCISIVVAFWSIILAGTAIFLIAVPVLVLYEAVQ